MYNVQTTSSWWWFYVTFIIIIKMDKKIVKCNLYNGFNWTKYNIEHLFGFSLTFSLSFFQYFPMNMKLKYGSWIGKCNFNGFHLLFKSFNLFFQLVKTRAFWEKKTREFFSMVFHIQRQSTDNVNLYIFKWKG